MRKWGGISSRAADAVIMRQKFVGERTARRTPHSTQTLLLGRLLGPVGVYGGASTHTRTRRSRLYMLVAEALRSTNACCVGPCESDARVYPQRLPDARGGEGSKSSELRVGVRVGGRRALLLLFFLLLLGAVLGLGAPARTASPLWARLGVALARLRVEGDQRASTGKYRDA